MANEDWLPEEILGDLRAKHATAEELLARKDPESEPYVSKYAARKILREMVEESAAVKDRINEGDAHACAVSAGVHSAIGCIDMDVEELAQGEASLKKAMEMAAIVDGGEGRTENRHLVALTKVKTLNQLGILWVMREDHEKAHLYLQDSLKVYEEFTEAKRNSSVCTVAYSLKNLLEERAKKIPDSFETDKAMELLNAYTYYFLAQVYQKMSKFEMSAKCCHTTLTKQLEMKEYQPLEWARNAATLSHHYTVHQKFQAAKLHLAAATFVLDRYRLDLDSKEYPDDNGEEEREAAEELFAETRAEVDRSWGKYALVLMESSMEAAVANQSRNDDNDLEVIDVEGEEEGDALDYEVEFSSIEPDPALTTELRHAKAATFEEAREIFLPGQRAFNKAKTQYYTLNDHCTDFAEIQRDLCRMHKVLIFFEKDEERQFKMHKRRIDLLETVYKELNPQMYRLLCRQLVFEIAETYSAMMDIKHAKFWRENSNAAKVNALVELSAGSFRQFLNLLKNNSGETPKKFDKDVCRPALLAHFHMGRLCDKYVGVPDNSEMKISGKLESLKHFQYVVNYCDAHPEAVELFASELTICQELVKLLPVKIQRMRAELRASSSS